MRAALVVESLTGLGLLAAHGDDNDPATPPGRRGGGWRADSGLELQPHEVTVVAFDRLECDRAITDTLLRADQPHLFLRPLPDGVVVGPLVVPGTTCCTRCMDLVRARDRAWPRLLAQLCLLECTPPREVLDWAVATALLQVRAWLAGGHPETLGATLEIKTDRWMVGQRHWPHHPDCGCAAIQSG